ncbi:MAG: hypothetical protein ACFE9R_08550 [Candidatus Hermodarchaeota archaeon]
MAETKPNSWKTKLIILAAFILVIINTAEVDWAAEHESVGLFIRIFWLASLLGLGLLLSIGIIYLAGNRDTERTEKDKKWLLVAIILFLLANGIPIIFYIVLGMSQGFFLYVQLVLFGLIPAYFLQPKRKIRRLELILILYALIILPLGILVNFTIDDLWGGITDKTMYYLSFWGLLMTFFYLIIAIGWKLGGGTKRQSWNIFIAGTLLQYSTLEDFLYFFLNGQALPGVWPWMSNFVINLEALFGRVPTDFDLLIFCIIISTIAILILFDVHGFVWKKVKSK